MLKRVRITQVLIVSDSRGIDLENPNNFNVTLLDKANEEVIFDTQLKLEGEKAYRPRVQVWIE